MPESPERAALRELVEQVGDESSGVCLACQESVRCHDESCPLQDARALLAQTDGQRRAQANAEFEKAYPATTGSVTERNLNLILREAWLRSRGLA